MAGHVDGLAGGVKAADAGAQHPGGAQRGNAAHLKDEGARGRREGTRVRNGAAAQRWLNPPCCQALGAPRCCAKECLHMQRGRCKHSSHARSQRQQRLSALTMCTAASPAKS